MRLLCDALNIKTFVSYSENEFPQYDRDNLLNKNMTEKVFDDGGFQRLMELKLQANSGTSLFSYKFDCPGTHVFQLYSNPNRKIYVRVMLPNTRCPDIGPFLPATTSNLIQLGISRFIP